MAGFFLALSKDSATKVFSMAEPTVKFNYAQHATAQKHHDIFDDTLSWAQKKSSEVKQL